MRNPGSAWFLLLSGCAGCEPEEELPTVLDAVSAEPTALWAGHGEGVGSAPVPFLVVNEFGASVAGADIGLTSTATLASAQVSPDATGWAYASVVGDGSGAFDITASQSVGSATGTGFLLTRPTVRLGFPAWPSTDADGPVSAAGGGVLAAEDNELWWFPNVGGAGVRVLALPDTVREALPVQLDDDGVTDLVAWSDSGVALLRGRTTGGLAFSAAWKPHAGTIAGAYVADLDKDAVADLLVVVNDGDFARVVWLSGSGQGTWEPTAVFDTDYNVYGVTAEDYDVDGIAEVTLLSDDGILRRYSIVDGDWQAASNNDFNMHAGPGSRIFGGFDLTNDDWLDVLVSGPTLDGDAYVAACASPGGTGQTVIYDLISETDPQALVGSFVADGDGDGQPDVFLSTPDVFQRARWSDTSATFSVGYKVVALARLV